MKVQSKFKGVRLEALGSARGEPKKGAAALARHGTEYTPSKGLPPSAQNDSEGETARMDSGLKQEIKDLEHRLENARMSDVDDRSDFGFSQVNSVAQGTDA